MVDIKNLRIGSHVLVGGVRAKVDGMDMPRPHWTPKYPLIRCKAVVDGETRYCGGNPLSEEIQPIPITSALLEELGFINLSDRQRIIYVNGNEDDNPWIDFKNLKDRWELFVCNNGWQGQTVCRYLHEAESFLSLHNIELIKE